jgi:ribosome-binding ATPase YchF (GTP1/OBG family)
MKKSICIIIFFLTHIVWGQSLYIIISSNNEPANYLKNLNYTKQHKNVKQLFEEANTVLKTIQKNGYLESSMLPITRLNDSTFTTEIDFGKQTQFIHIYIGTENNSLIGQNHSEITLPFGESENFLNDVLNKLENNGFSLAKVKLKTLVSKNDTLHVELDLQLDKKRVLNSIVVNGMDKFPVGFKKQLERLYKNKTFNTENLKKLSADIDQLGFVQQIKFPEVLFTKSNTDIYIYVEKSKSNSFDGFIGFNTNDKNTLVLNGYLDLSLQNILNSGEKMALNWKSNGSNQKDFQLSVELPFAFNSPVALKTQLRIFKQDTTFQNTNTHIGLGYYFTAHSKLFLNYESAESSDIQNANTALLNDFTNTFITADYNFSKHSTDFGAFKESNFINLKIGSGKRQAKTSDNTQFYGAVSAQYNWYLNPKNCIALKSQNYYLQSDQYITNELYRFGGINSIRGFTENSLQGNLFTSFSTEYRYSVAPTLYVHSIVDYGYYKDSTRNWDDRILGLGFGFGIVTKNGLFHLVYANGSSQNQTLKLNNSIVQISLKTRF